MKLNKIEQEQRVCRYMDNTFGVDFNVTLIATKFASHKEAVDFLNQLYTTINDFIQSSERNLKVGE